MEIIFKNNSLINIKIATNYFTLTLIKSNLEYKQRMI